MHVVDLLSARAAPPLRTESKQRPVLKRKRISVIDENAGIVKLRGAQPRHIGGIHTRTGHTMMRLTNTIESSSDSRQYPFMGKTSRGLRSELLADVEGSVYPNVF